MLEPCSPVQGFGIRRREVEVCGCEVVAAVYAKIIIIIIISVYLCMSIYPVLL